MWRESRARQFEYNHRWVYARHDLKDVFDFARDLPYAVGKLTPDRVELYDGWHFEMERFFEATYVLIHRGLVGRGDVAGNHVHPHRARAPPSTAP